MTVHNKQKWWGDTFTPNATNATSGGQFGGQWSRDLNSDTYTFNYPCGHGYSVTGNAMQRGGQVAPPLCPRCCFGFSNEPGPVIPVNPGFRPSYLPSSAASAASHSIFLSQESLLSGPLAWLDYQIGRVREAAWA